MRREARKHLYDIERATYLLAEFKTAVRRRAER